jgi:ribonuclease J
MFEWIRPHTLIPVHGEARHLYEHRRLGLASGVPHALVPNNGTLIKLAPGIPEIIDEDIPAGRLVIDGTRIIPQDSLALKQRHKLSLNGHILISVVIKGEKVLTDPCVTLSGICEPGEETLTLNDKIVEELKKVLKQEFKNDSALEDALRQAARRLCHAWFGKKPVADVHLIRV